MKLLARLLEPKSVAFAHCDLPCGVYDPAQARIEAESIKGIDEKYQQNTDPVFRKAPHFEKYPQLNELFNEATKLAGSSGTKGSPDPAVADQLLAKIEEISKIFWETKQA